MNSLNIGEHLIIVGSGGFAKEVAEWAKHSKHTILGFYDYTKPNLSRFNGSPVFHDISDFKSLGAKFIVAIGDNNVRHAEAQKLITEGLIQCDPIVHPSAVIAESARIGKGTIICPNAVICPDTVIGDGCIFNLNSTLGHDSVVGNYVNVAPGANLSGFSDIRDFVYIGTNAALREKLTVGAHSTVGMGATVVKPVSNDTTVVGVAAKPLEKK